MGKPSSTLSAQNLTALPWLATAHMVEECAYSRPHLVMWLVLANKLWTEAVWSGMCRPLGPGSWHEEDRQNADSARPSAVCEGWREKQSFTVASCVTKANGDQLIIQGHYCLFLLWLKRSWINRWANTWVSKHSPSRGDNIIGVKHEMTIHIPQEQSDYVCKPYGSR